MQNRDAPLSPTTVGSASAAVNGWHANAWVLAIWCGGHFSRAGQSFVLGSFCAFAGMAAMALAGPLLWPSSPVMLRTLGLALLSEGLQFFAIDRHPCWLDVGIDMSGALVGMAVGRCVAWYMGGRG